MLLKRLHTLRPSLLVFASILLLLFASVLTLAFPLRGSASALATSLHTGGTRCAQAPSFEHCSFKDPEEQGCARDAVTTAKATIVSQGIVVGRVERRFSKKCNSWWGRVFDKRSGPRGQLLVELVNGRGIDGSVAGDEASGAPQFVSSSYNIFYGQMFFDAATSSQAAPEIIGVLSSSLVGPQASVPSAQAPMK